MADEQEKDSQEQKKSKVKKIGNDSLLLILIGLNTLVMIGVAYFQVRIFQQKSSNMTIEDVVAADLKKRGVEAEDLATNQARELDGILFHLDSFTANLAQGDGPRRFVRLNVVLKFSKDSKEEEFNARKPQIRDAIINTLNSKRPEDLLKLEGKNYLKEEIKSSINSFLVDGHVIDVYYIGFQVK